MFYHTKIGFGGFAAYVGRVHAGVVRRRPAIDLQRDALIAAGVDKRHIHADKASGARDDRPGLKACLAWLKQDDTLVVRKLDRLGRSLPHLLSIITDFGERGIAFRSLTEAMDTTTPHGELLFSMFGALAQYERALTRERVMAGLAAAKRRGRQGGRPPMIDAEKIEAITAVLDTGASKAAVCRNFGVAHSTLIDTLARIGWSAPARA